MAKKALISSFVFLWLFLSGMTFSTWAQGVISLPQTGQTKCYNSAGTEIDCAGTGQEGEWEMGVEWPEPRFANPDGTVPITGGVVVDQLTGLMWARDAGTPTVRACVGGTKTWEQALAYVACLRS